MTRLPDQIDAPMTPRQLATLRSLSAEAYQPKLFEKNLTARGSRAADLRAEGGNRAGEFVLTIVRGTAAISGTLNATAPTLANAEAVRPASRAAGSEK